MLRSSHTAWRSCNAPPRLLRPVGDVLDEVEEGRLAPLEVVEDEHQRSPARRRLKQPAHGREGLLRAARGLRQTDQAGDTLADRPRIVRALDKGRKLCPTLL